jgi:hypothetical protein
MTLRSFFFMRRHRKACRELQRLVEQRRQSFAIEQYRRRRAAALKHTRAET